ncbi:hypothetical protein QBC47DRAFT_431639 [Echria macrotheca]|uniref:Rhodopsin domain-containing protein n=1 Tax=Echria macrotheca TaxID=438768 RepID=A0AAJ0B7R6_9PEZI|nr:hypothetical protein QBC47DRAFT_431639 [Echria macrotheca]
MSGNSDSGGLPITGSSGPDSGGLPINGTGGGAGQAPEFIPVSDWAAYCARIFIGSTSTLLLLCIITFCTRMYQRVRPVWKVGLDDYCIAAGFILSITDWGMLLGLMIPQPGLVPISFTISAAKNSWLAIGIWGMSMTFIKASIALTLLRIQGKSKAWRIFLFSIIALQTLYGVLNIFFNLLIACRPLEKAWNTFADGECVSYEVQRIVSNIGSAINIVTDVLLSLCPALFLHKLNRPLRERIFICILMGLGLFASVSSILKTVVVRKYGDPTVQDDFLAMGITISTYTVLEQFTGILAACVPAMKGILQSCLGRMGVSLSDSRPNPSGYYARSGGVSAVNNRNGGQAGSRYARRAQDDLDDEEKYLEMPELRRNQSASKSSNAGSGSYREDDKGAAVSIEVMRVPKHTV